MKPQLTNCLELVSRIDLKKLGDEITGLISENEIDYFVVENIYDRYTFFIKTFNNISKEDIAELLGNWIIEFYEPIVIDELLKGEFFEDETDRNKVYKAILDKSDSSLKLYNKKIIVKKITKYLESENLIQIDGLIRFRLCDYRNELYMSVCEAIEEFYIKKDYEDCEERV